MENTYSNENETINIEKEEFRQYLKSAERGDNEEKAFQLNLGYCYEKAFQWFLKSAEGENHNGQNNLGTCYRDGIGTIKDEGKAFQQYLKSAEGESSTGQINLGYCYFNGNGTIKDEGKAFQGSHKGHNNLGHCYRYGIGITKDEGKAFQLFLKSAEGGEK
ncbi:hypothetical protein Glove_692g14 [Diversispora epigaea]|uniref:Uncharacterized protein n=1 Tax=Diversispora epigaea TaxID=1348612 RepID=A0A397GAD9_9GLOM|nr:hypothetical protein Glove_692g14 [Diversispora epigaea]